jgi:hypothetical protein
MRQYRAYSITQTQAYAPDQDILQDTWTPITTRRASTFALFVLGFVLVTGMVVLLSLLSAWFSSSTSATATHVMVAEQAQVWTLSPKEVEELACFRC